MADFIAVIRRAVVGLTDNSAEMRLRVYDKARTAVQRQLENMKPQPPEEMLRRQMEKLENAIRQVEEEYTEALPPVDGRAIAAAPEIETPPAYEPESESQTELAPSRAQENPADIHASSGDGAADAETLSNPDRQTESLSSSGPLLATLATEPVSVSAGFIDQRHVAADPLPSMDQTYEPSLPIDEESKQWPAEIDSEPEKWIDPLIEPATFEQKALELQSVGTAADALTNAGPTPSHTGDIEAAKPEEDNQQTIRMPKARFDEEQALADFGDLLPPPPETMLTEPLTSGEPSVKDFSWDAPFDDLPEHPTPVAFEQALAAKTAEISQARAAGPRAAPKPTMPKVSDDPMADLDELTGLNRQNPDVMQKNGAPADQDTAEVRRPLTRLAGRSFKTQPKHRRRGIFVLVLAGMLSLIVVGGAVALWYNFDKVNTMVGGLITSQTAPPADQPVGARPAQTQQTATAGGAGKPTGTDRTDVAGDPQPASSSGAVVGASKPEPNAGIEVAALAGSDAGPQKFTQRLLTDGSETKGDDDKVKVDAGLAEGTSVASQTVQSASAEAPSNSNDQPRPAATGPLKTTQKTFLYEERLGQPSPVALAGTVAWSIKEETTAGGAKAEPVIVGQIDIPWEVKKEPDATEEPKPELFRVWVTFKRNTDPSLSASHIIEIVFSLPKNFEGGNIETVERIAMKQNEQDRGNALIGVPAKITDDFHMIALNDDKDAMANNEELLRSRSWIDIPITYRNGRRALMTMEKGATGTAAFEKAMREWTALGRTAGN